MKIGLKEQHENILHRTRPTSPRFHVDPACCARQAAALVWRYSCKFCVALGFGLSDWCTLCTDVGNRLGWKILTCLPQSRGVLARRHLFGLLNLGRYAMITDAQGHGNRVTSTGTTPKQTREECALCQRPEILDICVVCGRRCCFHCLANLPMWEDPPDTLFCCSCHSESRGGPKDKNR